MVAPSRPSSAREALGTSRSRVLDQSRRTAPDRTISRPRSAAEALGTPRSRIEDRIDRVRERPNAAPTVRPRSEKRANSPARSDGFRKIDPRSRDRIGTSRTPDRVTSPRGGSIAPATRAPSPARERPGTVSPFRGDVRTDGSSSVRERSLRSSRGDSSVSADRLRRSAPSPLPGFRTPAATREREPFVSRQGFTDRSRRDLDRGRPGVGSSRFRDFDRHGFDRRRVPAWRHNLAVATEMHAEAVIDAIIRGLHTAAQLSK